MPFIYACFSRVVTWKVSVHLQEVIPRGFLSHVVEYFEFVFEYKGSVALKYCLVEKHH